LIKLTSFIGGLKRLVFIYCLIFVGFFSYGQENDGHLVKDSVEILIKKTLDLYYDYKVKESLDNAMKVINYSYQLDNVNYRYRAYYIIGSNYEVIEDYENAKINYGKALKLAKESNDSIYTIRSLNGMGNVLVELDSIIDHPITYYNQSLELAKKVGSDQESLAPVLNIAWTYIDHKLYDKAYPFLNEAYKLAKTSKNPYAISDIKYLFGKYHLNRNEINKAIQLFNEVILISENEGLYSVLTDVYDEKSKIYNQQGLADSAYANLRKHLYYKNKLLDEEKLKQIEFTRVKFSVDEYQRELEAIKKEKEYVAKIARNNVAISITSISLGLLLVVIYFFYRGNRSKKKLNQALEEKNIQLLEAKTEAEKLTNVKSQFISTVSHELRTPLYGVVGITTLLLEDKDISRKNKKLLNSLKFSGDYLLDLINKVLKISKIESNKERLAKTPTNLLQLSQNLLHSFEYQAKNKNNGLVLEVQEEVPEIVLIDSLKLSEILINLIGNSSKFTVNGKIWLRIKVISIDKEEAIIRFEIEDNGLGIPEDKKEFVFEKFSQVGSEINKHEGTGLGLSIVKNLIQIMGSKIYLESKEGSGTKFYFDLTLEIVDQNDSHSFNLDGEDKVKVYRKILVAEDNKINQIVTKNLLDLIGHECTIVENGLNALQMVKKESFDLILMDLNMPYLNGIEATKRIREFDTDTPIIALTASELNEVQDDCIRAGMNDLINKPLNKDDLRDIISKNLLH